MSDCINQMKSEKDLPISYSINIKTLSTPKRPLTCYISTTPKQLNYIKPIIYSDKIKENNHHRSSIHLPITYSTSIHLPCHPSTSTRRTPIILPSQSSHHHYHHYYHHYYYHHYHQRQPPSSPSSRQSTTIKPTSIGSTRPTTTSTTTTPSPQSVTLSKKSNKNPTTTPLNKPSYPPLPPPPVPSYSTLVWNWFHHTPTKPQPHRKGSQSDYSEVHRHDVPSKRSLLFKLLTSPTDPSSKPKHHPTCFRRKRFESSSSLPNKYPNYHE